MSTEKKDNNLGPNFNITNNQISGSAIGTNPVVNNYSVDHEKLSQFSVLLQSLQKEVSALSNTLSDVDLSKAKNEITVVEQEIQKRGQINPDVILSSLKELSGLIGKITSAGVVVSQMIELAKNIFVR